MKLKNFIYCLSVNTAENRTDIQGILNTITPTYVPGLFSFSISFSVLDICEGEHCFCVKFKDPSGNVAAEIDNVMIPYRKDEKSNLPEKYSGINIAAGLQNVEFKKSGVYTTEVTVDGIDMGNFPIFVKGQNE